MDQSVIREALAAIRQELRSRTGKHLGPKDEPKADEAPAVADAWRIAVLPPLTEANMHAPTTATGASKASERRAIA